MTLLEGEWSYRGDFMEGEWSFYRGAHFNGGRVVMFKEGRMVMLQRLSL